MNETPSAIPFTVENTNTPLGSLILTGTSSNPTLLPDSGIVFGGSDDNRTVFLTPNAGVLGSAEITIRVSDGTFSDEETFIVTVNGVTRLVAGWDDWSGNSASDASLAAVGITASAVSSATTGNWSIADDNSSGRGSSGDGTWGSFEDEAQPASQVTSGQGANMTAVNGVADASVIFTIANTGAAGWDLKGFHMDVVAFRPNAPRAFQLEVLSGDVSNGVVFASVDNEISHLGGDLSGNHDEHDEIDIDLSSLFDSTLEPGESAVIRIQFSSGTGSGGGHHLFLDNVAFSGVTTPMTGLQRWRSQNFGSIENSGIAADAFDADRDGETNFFEFATHQNPFAGTVQESSIKVSENMIEIAYTRSKAALADGVNFQVKWSDNLLPGSWSVAEVLESIDVEDSESVSVVASLPNGSQQMRFVRFVVTR